MDRTRYFPASVAEEWVIGQNDQALTGLEKAYETNSMCMVWLKMDPRWDAARSDPRFRAVLDRMHFPM